mgnify:CR=1 FL=1
MCPSSNLIYQLSDSSSKGCFYYRVDEPTYHTFIIKSDYFIFHETTQGPFKRADTIYAPWYVEGMFYADSSLETVLGGDSRVFNYALEPGISTLWHLTYSSSINELDYPNFAISNLRAYLNE